MNNKIILGLDVSTKTIGVCLYLNDGLNSDIIKLTHYQPKINSKIKGIESLFLKKQVFEEEFLQKEIVNKGIKVSNVVIEEPLLGSNNINTVATLLRFNGMISDSVYRLLGVVPDYVSSYDARKYAFPELMAIRQSNKKGENYPLSKIKSGITKTLKTQHLEDKKKRSSSLTLFGAYPWDIDKKQVIWEKINELYPKIEWVYDKKNKLKKENFDSTDALTVILAYVKILEYGYYDFTLSDVEYSDESVDYKVLCENNTKTILHSLNI